MTRRTVSVREDRIMIAAIYARKSTEQNDEIIWAKPIQVTFAEVVGYPLSHQ